ncbi:MAG: energy-coupling factor ABC transporter ATP-binding protein [Candidatus Marinimicrobia bacterium]|nr:energy-coupling factor ABC transporter ATP-binding protein [Candidatus Neomarinimicrobiota bacterium]MCF7839958.1 energy-coupling factor ABC transporter ATP-binding protein [Candidatus Neomarinimicrobiota bacterium]MCF7902871.1 energy-coupling factor ABC transporter ATP-binding protein [Candidatus Neomarinimicrobiota bacterium]
MKNNFPGHTGIQVRHVHLTYVWRAVQRVIFKGLSLTIEPGEFVTIYGDNASGKTSLLKLLTGLQKPDQGDVWVHGINVSVQGVTGAREAGVGFLSQNPVYQILGQTVEEELDYVPGVSDEEKENILNQFGLERRLKVAPQNLSGGERQRLALAVLVLQKMPLLLLDEPTSYLDALQVENLRMYLEKIHAKGTTIVHVTQYPEEAAWGTRTLQLETGKLKELA